MAQRKFGLRSVRVPRWDMDMLCSDQHRAKGEKWPLRYFVRCATPADQTPETHVTYLCDARNRRRRGAEMYFFTPTVYLRRGRKPAQTSPVPGGTEAELEAAAQEPHPLPRGFDLIASNDRMPPDPATD